jgi:amidophosphoribosyltransferase
MMDGITGIYSLEHDPHIVKKCFDATTAIQNRGEPASGIAFGNNEGIDMFKGLGNLTTVVDTRTMEFIQKSNPIAIIGNVGYTKNEDAFEINAEPIEVSPKTPSRLKVALTMDGYLVKEDDLKKELEKDYKFETGNKTEVVGALLHQYLSKNGINFEAGGEFLNRLNGRATFSLAALVYNGKETRMITLNDAKAFEPFCYGTIDNNFVVSSESCSHRKLGGFMEREYDGGEMTICSFSNGPETMRFRSEKMIPDIFQGIYFGNVHSMFRGQEISTLRQLIGHSLVEQYGLPDTDIVIPNPESGVGVTRGIFEKIKEKLYEKAFSIEVRKIVDMDAFNQFMKLVTVYNALPKLPQAVRTFQVSKAKKRMMDVGTKFGAIDSLLKDQRVVMGDDSIVKGSVSEGGAFWTLFNAGIKSLEFWISYAPMFFPSFKGWHNGIECLEELAVRKAFGPDVNIYKLSTEEINNGVARRMANLLKVDPERIKVKYNTLEEIRKITGDGSFQALNASYPIAEEYWPDFIKEEVEKFKKAT